MADEAKKESTAQTTQAPKPAVREEARPETAAQRREREERAAEREQQRLDSLREQQRMARLAPSILPDRQ